MMASMLLPKVQASFVEQTSSLVHIASIVAALKLFSLAFFSAASARGQWKSPFSLAVIQEPPVEITFPLAVFLSNHQWKIAFPLAVCFI
jgi:hypothetical protein